MTIGDFWGSWKKYGKRFDEGISVFLTSTAKGAKLAELVKDRSALFEELNEKEAIASNDNFTHPVKRPTERTGFYNGIINKGYRGIWRKTYFTKTYRKKSMASLYGALVPAKFRFFVNKLLKR